MRTPLPPRQAQLVVGCGNGRPSINPFPLPPRLSAVCQTHDLRAHLPRVRAPGARRQTGSNRPAPRCPARTDPVSSIHGRHRFAVDQFTDRSFHRELAWLGRQHNRPPRRRRRIQSGQSRYLHDRVRPRSGFASSISSTVLVSAGDTPKSDRRSTAKAGYCIRAATPVGRHRR